MRELLRKFGGRLASSGPVLHIAGTMTAVAIGAAILPALPGPRQGTDQSTVRFRERAADQHYAAVRVYVPPSQGLLVFVSAYVGVSSEMLDWMELERERLGLSSLRRGGAELPLFVAETRDTAPFLAELEFQREQLGESIFVRVTDE
jgi:hypothetical protein